MTGALFTDTAVREPGALVEQRAVPPTASLKAPWGSIPSHSPSAAALKPYGPSAADRMRALRARVRHRIASRPVVSPISCSRDRSAASLPSHSLNQCKKARNEPSIIDSALPHRPSCEDAPLLYGASFGSPSGRHCSKREPLLNPLEARFLDDALVHDNIYASDSDRYVVGGASSSGVTLRNHKRDACDISECNILNHEGNAHKRICRGGETTARVTSVIDLNGAQGQAELAANSVELAANSVGPHRLSGAAPRGGSSGAADAHDNCLVRPIVDASPSAAALHDSSVLPGLSGAAPPAKRLRIRGKTSPC